MIVYSNSCSLGGAGQGHKIYPEIIAESLGAEVVNGGMEGSINRRIIRTSIRDLTELKQQHQDIVALIGLTFLARTELWQPWLPAIENDGHFQPIIVDHSKVDWSIKGLIDTIVPNIANLADRRVKDYYQQWLLHYHTESAVTDLLTDIIMFSGWAQSNNIRHVIFSNPDTFPDDSKVGYNSPFIKSLREDVESNPFVVNPWTTSFNGYILSKGFKFKESKTFRLHGHPDQGGHQAWANFLIERLRTNQ